MISKKSSSHSGFTLIELLVAMTISSVMATIAITHLWTSRQLSKIQEAYQIVEENARYTFDTLTREIKRTGYSSRDSNLITATPTGMFFRDACDETVNCTADGLNNESDRIAIWIRPENDAAGLRSCNGRDLTGILGNDETLINSYYIETDVDKGITSLMCESFTVDQSLTVSTFNQNKSAVIEGVENIQFQYGVFTDLDDPTPVSYVSADSVIEWGNISAVRIVALISTAIDDGQGKEGNKSFEMSDTARYVPQAGDYCFENYCRMYSTTVFIENAGL